MPEGMKLPEWVFKNDKPRTDKEYFENLTRCIFQAGLSWQLISRKWPNFRKAFDEFDIVKIAAYGAKDIKRLSEDKGIICNNQKILATIENARAFERIAEENGNFKKWLGSLDKSNNYEMVVKTLKSNFRRVGPSTAHIFLWSVGESIKHDSSVHTREPTKIV
jgi:DNA-3-methyladenine glycosylase I